MPSKPKHRLLIMAGGTGGHVMPALAVAQKLKTQGIDIHWLGTQRGIESRLVPQADIPLHTISIQGLRGKGFLGYCLAPFRIIKAFWQSFRIIRQIKPDTVVSMGGYVAGPGGVAAWIQRIPLIVHEQNSISGLTNKLLAPFAHKILVAFPKTFEHKKVVLTGNPVRDSIVQVGENKRIEAQGPLKVLIIGGSLGARAINQVMPEAIAIAQQSQTIEFWHQTGQADLEATRQAYVRNNMNGKTEAFIDNMAQAYEWADLVIARAGALTIAEVSAAGVPSILIPFPHAVDDHQSSNARYLSDQGAAILLPQTELTVATMAEFLSKFAQNKQQLALMAQQSHQLAKPQATETVANYCVNLDA